MRDSVKRTRNYATVVYPESAPENWLEILSSHFVPSFVSPLHDKDINPTGEVKKPHYHVIIMFDNVKTREQAAEIFKSINGVGCETINSIRGYARYLCHLDNPEKAQYNTEDVRCLSGADYTGIIGLAIDKYKAIDEMVEFCNDNGIEYYCDLLDYCRYSRRDWFRILCDSGTYVIREFLKSSRYKRMDLDTQNSTIRKTCLLRIVGKSLMQPYCSILPTTIGFNKYNCFYLFLLQYQES